ncbi:MAG: hypothetical protein IT384_11010 [Deltaproteobacteria bacterium]|nr:hypothetical protein [Deltaproteobacteria bacterium]
MSLRVNVFLILAAATPLIACEPPDAEYRRALPDRATLLVPLPGQIGTESQSLGAIGRSEKGLVGGPADLYTTSYYHARDLNALIGHVFDVLEAITQLPATIGDDHRAVWGPLSDAGEPNEYLLAVERIDAPALHYGWVVAGKHKSAAHDAYAPIAAGAFEPTADEEGRGWLVLDFDAVAALDPSEAGAGRIAYAFTHDANETAVFAEYQAQSFVSRYAFANTADGGGFVLFAYPADIDEGQPERAAIEDVMLATRWLPSGLGRSDVIARGGDLGDAVATASQCWGASFESTYEAFGVSGQLLAEDGDRAACALPMAGDSEGELLSDQDLECPYPPTAP